MPASCKLYPWPTLLKMNLQKFKGTVHALFLPWHQFVVIFLGCWGPAWLRHQDAVEESLNLSTFPSSIKCLGPCQGGTHVNLFHSEHHSVPHRRFIALTIECLKSYVMFSENGIKAPHCVPRTTVKWKLWLLLDIMHLRQAVTQHSIRTPAR